LAVIDSIHRDLRNFGAVVFHGHPENVVHVASAILVPGGACRTHGDIVATIALFDIVIVQVPRNKLDKNPIWNKNGLNL